MKIHKKFIVATQGAFAVLALSLGITPGAAQPYSNAVAADHPIAY